MPFRKRAPSAAADALGTTPDIVATPHDADDALAEAEAEAAEAEAEAALSKAKAARARAAALRVKQQRANSADEASVEHPDRDDAPPTTSESNDAETSDARSQQSHWVPLRWISGTLAILLIIALIAVSVLMVNERRKTERQQQEEAEFIAAGRQGVVTLMSLNFNSIDEDIQRIVDNSTGEFKKDFENKANDFTTVARDSKVITEAIATAAGLESLKDHKAVVLVAAQTKVTNKAGAVQEPRSWRLLIHLVREGDGGQIKMSRVDFAP